MEDMKVKLVKLREERMAREKARIDKLRELNLKKYSKEEKQTPINNSVTNKKVDSTRKSILPVRNSASNRTVNNPIKNVTAVSKISSTNKVTVKTTTKAAGDVKKTVDVKEKEIKNIKDEKGDQNAKIIPVIVAHKPAKVADKPATIADKPVKVSARKSMIPSSNVVPIAKMPNMRKSMVPSSKPTLARDARKSFVPQNKGQLPLKPIQPKDSRRTLMPQISESKESVFDRLYKPKMVKNVPNVGKVDKLQNDVKFREKIINQSNLLLNNKKRHTVFESKPQTNLPVRRSISAVHFKRIGKNELTNCFHKWASSENISNLNLNGNEDEGVRQDKVVSAIKSDRKKVNFKMPMSNFNTPRPAELQSRLKEWLQKRGKAIDQYHHLQCFGLHHMAQNTYTPSNQKKLIDEENKENIAADSDSDNDSYSESMGQKWRRASGMSSADLNETKETLSEMSMHSVDDLVVGALNDLTELLKEGFDWEQSARWLRAVRERFPPATALAAYWECRAALEERQGNLPASVHCWEQAVAMGTERSVVEANLDQLLDKFMQLKISPRSAKKSKEVNPKLVDVKNVFKSTIIRFAVQQAKIRQSSGQARYTITPVRRSGRVSGAYAPASLQKTLLTPRGRAPLVQICSSVRQFRDAEFVPNERIPSTP